MNTKGKGGETEAEIIHTFISRGYSISVPFGDNDKYDIIVDSGQNICRVQCKTGWANKDATTQKMELRFDAEINHPSINWAEDYEFDGEIR
ncbi:group I intron-associated PD-(D/E)XK endonuclease [Haladaptatus caseinilyticus]|uniref:group I intron-associated PD-(D/E)XK endonuclease n=1 Tax=Haladaptatus caseinilyticus TaxID=2993314 RepID=UPI00224AFD95|nr:group I intron-associated PD-(D/E)XK endonuclease [Haladaptatus caseinilyticus]